MKNFFKYVLATIVGIFGFFAIITIVFLFFAILSALFSPKQNVVPSESVLELSFNNPVYENVNEQERSLFSFDNGNPIVYSDYIDAIESAKTDDRIKGISLDLSAIEAGASQLESIREKILEFKETGKFVYSYGDNYTQNAYYLASVSDSIFLNPLGGVDLIGMSAGVTFFKEFGDKYGIDFQIIRHGKYKSAVEPFLRNDMSEANREQYTELITSIWEEVSQEIADSRNIDVAQLNVITDSLYGWMSPEAKQHKLIDVIAQETEYRDFLKAKMNVEEDNEVDYVSIKGYVPNMEVDTSGDKIAVIYASGQIFDGKGYQGIFADDYVKMIEKIREDEHIKGVVLRVNSPGGSAMASDAILHELNKLKKEKPLVVSFGDYAASGGYYISMAAEKIFSEPTTITGSIGVLGMIPNTKKLLNNIGINNEFVQTNANSLGINIVEPLTEHTKQKLTQGVEFTYERFVNIVKDNRDMSFAQVDSLGQGRVWSGEDALDKGLVDELGGLEEAVAYCAQLMKSEDYQLVSYPKRKSDKELFEQMFGQVNTDKILQNELSHEHYQIYTQLKVMNEGNKLMMITDFRLNN